MHNRTDKTPLSSRRRLFFFFAFISLLTIFLGAFFYLGTVIYRGRTLYAYLKSHQRGWQGHVHTFDPELGFAPIPGARGAHIFPQGPAIPMRYDKDGFRVPVAIPEVFPRPRPLVLALGGSFTYGDATYAKDTFPYLVGKYLGGSSINAGVCSYGLLEMLLRARKLIPLYHPDYVLVQFSPWLVKRARRPFGPMYFGFLPTSFFYEKNGELAIHPPVFATKIFDLPIDRYRNSQNNLFDFTSFIISVELPLLIHDDFNMALFRLKNKLGIIPPPSGNDQRIASTVYREIVKIAEENHARPIIVFLPWWHTYIKPPDYLKKLNAPLVDTQTELLRRLPRHKKRRSFRRRYCHYRGSPPVLIDRHPNPAAHRIIAEQIVKTINIEPGWIVPPVSKDQNL